MHLYDTASRTLRPFEPLRPGEVSIYLCGLTVQGPPHIGHVRNWITTDVLRRWLEYRGLKVTLVRNVTDIDDKILTKAAANDEPWWALAFRGERAVAAAEAALGCEPPAYEPRATGHVPEMVELMQRLIERGHAYAVEGDVYFDVRSWPDYGELSGQKVDDMLAAGDSAGDDRKRDPRDFALWKGAKAGEPSWPTPWGAGRPGWHLECSAMATKYLGPQFDIHGGGLDLVFPHHENELAQSRAAGDPFANYWLHNGLLTMAGEKMSKSLGNTLQVAEMVRRYRPVELRYYLGGAHYRSTMEFSEDALAEAGAAYRRIENFLRNAPEVPDTGEVPAAFAAAMDDDLGVPAALANVHETVRAGNSALAEGDVAAARAATASVAAMTTVLGLHPAQWDEPSGADAGKAVEALVQIVLDQRAAARARKDYAAADSIRDELTAAGIAVEDTAGGTRWTLQ